MFLSDYESWCERLESVLGKDRYQHSLRVSALSGELASFWQLDREKALTAGLLHDVARELPVAEMLAFAEAKIGAVADDLKRAPILLHAPLGAIILKEEWDITDGDILEAVSGHTLARPSMRPLTKIIYLADLLDPVRNWDGIEEIRALVYRDLDQAISLALKYQLVWLKRQKKYIHPAIYDAYDYYLESNDRLNRRDTLDSIDLLLKCVELAKEKKALGIMSMELKGLTIISDYFLLMTATNSRQAQALADHISEETKKIDYPPLRVEGHREGEWILLDFGAVVVHIFQEEQRKYYNLERLWGDAPKVEY